MDWLYILGFILLVYGAFKLFIGIMILVINEKNKHIVKNSKILSKLVRLDTTTAGKFMSLAIVVFAIFSILRGLYLIKYMKNRKFNNILSHDSTIYILYGILGILLTLFYSFVVFSQKSKDYVSSDDTELPTYKFTGIGTGIFFLISLIATYMYNTRGILTKDHLAVLVITLSILTTCFILILIDGAEKLRHTKQEILTMVMVPLASL